MTIFVLDMNDNKMLKAHSQAFAPFGSVAPRQKRKDKKGGATDPPGPGAYQISLPLIHPIIETIRKKNNNVIVKLNHIGTAAFHQDGDRFKECRENSVGPGQYSPQRQKQKEVKRKWVRAGDKLSELIKDRPLRRPAIEEVKCISIDQYVDMPGMIRKDTLRRVPRVRGTEWAKMAGRSIYANKARSQSVLGPGEYDTTVENAQIVVKPSAAFRSESIRSFFDNIYFDTNREHVARERQEGKYKASSIGPGSYELQPSHNTFHKYQFFNSTEERK